MPLSHAVVLLSGLAGALLVAVLWLLQAARTTGSALAVVEASLEGMADGASTRDSVAAIKRLLREVFAEQLSIRQRLAATEKAASVQLEAADDYQLRLLSNQGSVGTTTSTSSSHETWSRAPVRFSGHVVAAGALPWSQEADGSAAVSQLQDLGAGGAADMSLQLHSVLAGGKRRLTAELCQGRDAEGGAPSALRLQRLLYRVQANSWLQLMIAPLGGGLDVFGRSLTPVRGDFGCTQAVRSGHGLSALQHAGSGKAISVTQGKLSAAAGFFVGGASKVGVSQLQLRSQDGKSLALVAAHCKPRGSSTSGDQHQHQQQQQTGLGASSSSSMPCHSVDDVREPAARRLRFLGVQSPQVALGSGSSGGSCTHPPRSGAVLGGAGVLPIGDALTATAWAEQPACGRPGWGVGLYVQPDDDGLELVLGLGKAAAWRQDAAPRPLFCEVSAKVPAGDGLSISPCAVFSRGAGGSSLAYVMQSCWRF